MIMSGRLSCLAHQRMQIAFRIVEVHHPEIVVFHSGNEMRLSFQANTTGAQAIIRRNDIGNHEVDNGTGVIEFWLLGFSQHQAHTRTVEKSRMPGGEEQRQA